MPRSRVVEDDSGLEHLRDSSCDCCVRGCFSYTRKVLFRGISRTMLLVSIQGYSRSDNLRCKQRGAEEKCRYERKNLIFAPDFS